MLHSKATLDPSNIYLAAGNQYDETTRACQCYWIAEAIHYSHRAAVEKLFKVLFMIIFQLLQKYSVNDFKCATNYALIL